MSFAVLLTEESRTQYTESNYRDALLKLEQDGLVVVDPPAEGRRMQAGGEKRTLPKSSLLRFKK